MSLVCCRQCATIPQFNMLCFICTWRFVLLCSWGGLCNLFFLPILLLWQKKLLAQHPPTVQTEQDDGTSCDVYLPIHNFADDTLIVATSRAAAEKVARDFISYLEDFQMQAHKGTPTTPKSKTVVCTSTHPVQHGTRRTIRPF